MTGKFTALSAMHSRDFAPVFSFVIFLLLSIMPELSAQDLQGTFESKFARYRDGQSFTGTQVSHWADTVWRGDRVYKQILLWSPVSVSNITYEVSQLAFGTNYISADRVNLRFVSNVMGDTEPKSWRRPYPPTGDTRTRVLIGDALQNEPVSGLQAGDLVKIWTKIDIPSTTIPGTYTGSISVKSNGTLLKTFTISLLVTNHILPGAAAWDFHLNIGQFPFNLSNIISEASGWQWNFYDYFSEPWFSRLEPFYKLLVDMGQKDLTAYGFDGAFQQGLTMIKWKFNADKTVSLNFSNFDKYVEKLTSWGFSGNINCFVMNGWKNSYTYPDGTKEDINSIGYYTNLDDITPHWENRMPNKPDGTATSDFAIRWKSFLQQFRSHLNEKGWFNRTVLSFDETNVNDLKSIYMPLIEGDSRDWKVGHTGRKADDELSGKLYNYCLNLKEAAGKNPVSPENVFAFYTSNNDSIPNSFLTTQNNPAEMTWLAWYAKNNGFNGYARWAYDFWKNADVTNMQDNASTAGDCELVYRSSNVAGTTLPVSSIRLELLRDGIQDYEKAKILGNDLGPLQNIMAQFTDDSGTNSLALVVKGQGVIKKLSVNPDFFMEGNVSASSVTKISGSVIGSEASQDGTSTREKAFDNNAETWYNASLPNGQWAGLDFGSSQAIVSITFTPRSGWSQRMKNGKFQISNDAAFTNPVTIYTIPETFNTEHPGIFSIKSPVAQGISARYFRYLSPDNGYCNVAEINVFRSACTYTLNPVEAPVGSAASTEATKGNFSVTVTGTNCLWMPAKTADWITGVAKAETANQDGTWTVTYSYAENTGIARTGTITVGSQTHTVNQAAAATPCTYTLTPAEASVGSAASTEATKGNFSVTVTGTNCLWTPAKTADWITGVAKAGTANQDGTWTVTYSFAENTGIARTGTITVGSQTHTVNQAAAATPCTYTLTPAEASVGSAASTEATKGNFSVTVTGTNCLWTPAKTADWITGVAKAGTANQDGTRTVTYSFAENTGIARTGTITVGSQTHTVNQAAAATPCTYTLTPAEASVGSAASTEATKGNFAVTVTGTNCLWTPAKTADWITGVAKAGTANQDGTWTVTYSYAENTGIARTGTITVGNQTHTVNQAAAATPCTYTLTPAEASVGSAASTEATKGNFSVTVTGTNCSWTPAKTADWITGVSKAATANQDGTWTVTYSYTANTTPDERRGTITVGDKTHTVIQAGTVIASASKNGSFSGAPLTCYPNPVVANFVHVVGLNEPIRNAFLLTFSGQKIELTVLPDEAIDVSKASPGFYIIVVNETAKFKVIKVN